MDYDYLFRVCVTGIAQSGKSRVVDALLACVTSISTPHSVATLANTPPHKQHTVYFNAGDLEDDGSSIIRLQLWEQAPDPLLSTLLIQAHVILVVYDLMMPGSISATQQLAKQIREMVAPYVLVYVIGNKLDVVLSAPNLIDGSYDVHQSSTSTKRTWASDRQHDILETSGVCVLRKWAMENGVMYEQVSAATGIGVDHLFRQLIQEVIHQTNTRPVTGSYSPLTPLLATYLPSSAATISPFSLTLPPSSVNQQRSNCCCCIIL